MAHPSTQIMFYLSYMRHNLGHQSLKTKDLKKFESHNALTKRLQTVSFQKKLNNFGLLEIFF